MVDTAKIEAEAKAVAAETTSVLSSLLGTWNPRWPRFVETWRGWPLRKRIEAGIAVAIFCGGIWYFGLSAWHLGVGGYRSAYAYGHGDYVTRTEVKAVKDNIMATLASVPTQAQFSDLEAKVNELEAKVQAADKPAQITTGSIAKKRRPAPVKSSASSWFSLP
jgi:hypothetical protein